MGGSKFLRCQRNYSACPSVIPQHLPYLLICHVTKGLFPGNLADSDLTASLFQVD